jgi:hypothetical protein
MKIYGAGKRLDVLLLGTQSSAQTISPVNDPAQYVQLMFVLVVASQRTVPSGSQTTSGGYHDQEMAYHGIACPGSYDCHVRRIANESLE